MEIVLKFNKETLNNKELSDDEIINEAVWLVNCAMAAIEQSYIKGSPRFSQMNSLRKCMMDQIKLQLNREQFEEFKNKIS